MISAIVARAKNGVIGNHGDLPWHLPDDLVSFRRITRGHAVIMGRTTYDSIVMRLGHGLPDRKNIVLTRNRALHAPGAALAHSADEAIVMAGDDAFVLGGAQIYEEMLSRCSRLYITEVDTIANGDAYFPFVDEKEWREVAREHHDKDARHAYAFDFVVYDRVS